jgi:hypothetical protein
MSKDGDIKIENKPTGFLGGGTPVRQATITVGDHTYTGTGPDDQTAVAAAQAAQAASQPPQS